MTYEQLIEEHDSILGKRLKLEAYTMTAKYKCMDDKNKNLHRELILRMRDLQRTIMEQIAELF